MTNVKRCKFCKRTGLQIEMKRGWLRKLADGTYQCNPLCRPGLLAVKVAARTEEHAA